jgi:hypothetical protein
VRREDALPDRVRIFSGESVVRAKRMLDKRRMLEGTGPRVPRDFLRRHNGLRRMSSSAIRGIAFLLTKLTEYIPT